MDGFLPFLTSRLATRGRRCRGCSLTCVFCWLLLRSNTSQLRWIRNLTFHSPAALVLFSSTRPFSYTSPAHARCPSSSPLSQAHLSSRHSLFPAVLCSSPSHSPAVSAPDRRKVRENWDNISPNMLTAWVNILHMSVGLIGGG